LETAQPLWPERSLSVLHGFGVGEEDPVTDPGRWHNYDADPTGGDMGLADDPMWSWRNEVPTQRPARPGETCWECGGRALVAYDFSDGPRSVPFCGMHDSGPR
jgi:hypothetical protein